MVILNKYIHILTNKDLVNDLLTQWLRRMRESFKSVWTRIQDLLRISTQSQFITSKLKKVLQQRSRHHLKPLHMKSPHKLIRLLLLILGYFTHLMGGSGHNQQERQSLGKAECYRLLNHFLVTRVVSGRCFKGMGETPSVLVHLVAKQAQPLSLQPYKTCQRVQGLKWTLRHSSQMGATILTNVKCICQYSNIVVVPFVSFTNLPPYLNQYYPYTYVAIVQGKYVHVNDRHFTSAVIVMFGVVTCEIIVVCEMTLVYVALFIYVGGVGD